MNTIKILIAGVMVALVTSVLTGCASEKEVINESNNVGVQRIAEAQKMIKTVSLSLTEVKGKDGLNLRLTLNNPEKKPITSVQAWLAYNPDVLEGVLIDTKNTAFDIVAPYNNDFDQVAGLVMIGRSSADPVSDKEIAIADLHFKRIGEGAAMIEAFDYRQDLAGHTSANMMLDGVPVNIMIKPQIPLVIINN